MVTAITLGTFFNINGRTVLGGVGGSGLDTEALLNAIVEARRVPIVNLEDDLTRNASEHDALVEFNQLLGNYQTALDGLRNKPGVGNASANAFEYRTASISSNTSISGSSYVSVTAEPGAELQSYEITNIVSLARATKQSTDINNPFLIADADTTGLVVSGVPAAGQFKAGTFTVNGQNITLTTSDTLNSIAAKFNAVKAQSGISSTVVKVDDGEFVLSFSATATGTANDFDLEDPGTVTDATGVLAQITIADTQDATDAEFDFDGITVLRSTNAIDDLVDGITFTILQDTLAAPATIITASIEPDTEIAEGGIVSFINAYNEIRAFAAEQTQLASDGTYSEDAILARNFLFRSAIDTLATQISGLVNGVTFQDLSDIGITFTDLAATTDIPRVTNVLTADNTTLQSALAANYEEVRQLFEFTLTSENPNLRVFTRTNALDVTEFTLNINPFETQETEELTVVDADTQIAFAAPVDGQLGVGVVTVNGQTITIVDGDTLNIIAGKFDAVAGTSGLDATVNMISAGVFTLSFVATRQTGLDNFFDLTSDTLDPSGVFDTVDVTATGVFEATYEGDAGPVTIDLDGEAVSNGIAYLLTGQDGTVLEGLQLIYGSTAADEFDVTTTQGLADVLYNTVTSVVNTTDGTLETELESLADDDVRIQARIDQLNEQLERYRDFLLNQFAALEQVIASVNNLLNALDANDQARRQAAS